MDKPLFLFVGKSASGKTSIANMLEVDGYTQIQSYTTRPPRYENEIGHVFISEEEYEKLENIMAYTYYNNYHYCTTLEQVQNADLYVVDVPGVATLLNNYSLLNRNVCIVYFDSNVCNRIKRMSERGDGDSQIIERLLTDESNDWVKQLKQIPYISFGHVGLKIIDANLDLQDVYSTVKDFIQKETNKDE